MNTNTKYYILTLNILMAGAAFGQTVTNGGFEDATGMTFVAGGAGDYYHGVTPNWTWTPSAAGSTAVNHIKSDYLHSPSGVTGNWYLEGGSYRHPGTLSQAVSGFIVGEEYQLNFDWGNREDSNAARNAFDFDVKIADQTFTRSGDSSLGITNMTTASLRFKASSTTETVSIVLRDPDDGNNSATMGAFDNFQVSKVPEPSSTALLGLGALGLLARRKR